MAPRRDRRQAGRVGPFSVLVRRGVFLWVAGVFLSDSRAVFADQVIDQFIVLVHPCCYEAIGTPMTDPFRAREEEARQRWAEAITPLAPSTFVVQVDYAQNLPANQLHDWFVSRLGAGRVARIPVRVVGVSTPGPLREYHEDIKQQVTQQMAAEGLTFDPATVPTTIWGESFEGCAAGYGSAVAWLLGLKTPTTFDYAMSVPDAPFILTGTFLQTVPVQGSDIEAYLFDLNDGRFAAYFRSTLTPQWLDYRPINLQLDSRFSVLTKQGYLVWPDGAPPAGPQPFALSTVQTRYVVGTNVTELLSVINGATVTQTGLVTDTFSRLDEVLATDSLGDAEFPDGTYHWSESDLTWDNPIDAADMHNEQMRFLAKSRQATLSVECRDIPSFNADVVFAVSGQSEGVLPQASAGIAFRKGSELGGLFFLDELGKICIELMPSGFMRIIEVQSGGYVLLYANNPWTLSGSTAFGAPGSLPATVNGEPFDADQNGSIHAAGALEGITLGAILDGNNLSVFINDASIWSGTLENSGSGSGHNYISLFENNWSESGATVTAYFDNLAITTPQPSGPALVASGLTSLLLIGAWRKRASTLYDNRKGP